MKKRALGWAIYTIILGLAFIGLFIVTSMGFGQVTGFV